MTRRGVDISKYQGSPDWPAVKADGIEFAIISTGDGQGTNPLWVSQLMGARDVGIDVDLYHFLRFGVAPATQAALMRLRWEIAQPLGARRYWLDVEDTETGTGTVPANVLWLHELIAHLGGIPIGGIYTAAWYWVPHMGNTAGFRELPLWDAGYVPTEPTSDSRPVNYGGWTSAAIWQWSSSGTVDGINGNVDMNVSYEVEDDMPQFTEDEARFLREKIMKDLMHIPYEDYRTYREYIDAIATGEIALAAHQDNHQAGGAHEHEDYSDNTHTHKGGETGPAVE